MPCIAPLLVVASCWPALAGDLGEAGPHEVSACEGGYRAENATQRFVTVFDGEGFTTTPDEGAWTWGLELRSYGFAGSEEGIEGRASMSFEGARVAYAWGDGLEEWFVNDGRGLEHGFTLCQRPVRDGDAAGPLAFDFSVRGGLRGEVQASGRDVWFRGENGAAVVHYTGLLAFDAEGRVLPARFEQVAEGLRLTVQEDGARYPLTIDPIVQQAYLKASNTGTGDVFGFSVAASGDTVVVGAPGEDSSATGVDGDQSDDSSTSAGAAYVFVRSGMSWRQQAYLKASNAGALDSFGGSIAASGDTVVVGAYAEDSAATGVDGDQSDDSAPSAGAVYVFVRNGTSWSQQAYLKASNTDEEDFFGLSVSVSGEAIVVGAFEEDGAGTGVNGDPSSDSAGNAGAAYAFVRHGTTWRQQGYLKASNTQELDDFGWSVAISGDTLIVGADHESSAATGVNGDQGDESAPDSGAAYVFVMDPAAGPGAPLCFGDGSVAPCACGNEGFPDGGCANSVGAGAILYGIGDASLSSDTLELITLHLPNTPGLTFQGNTALPSPDAFGDGLRCCGDSSVRLITVLAQFQCASTNQPSGCGTQIGGIGGAISQHPGNAGLQAGDTRCYQHWYRDPIAGPCGTGFNLSNGYVLTWGI